MQFLARPHAPACFAPACLVGDIILHIHPILSEVKEDLKIINGQEFPLANSATRESHTIARVRNGEVIVISGLMQTRATGDKAGAPGLSEVPLLGSALEQKQRPPFRIGVMLCIRLAQIRLDRLGHAEPKLEKKLLGYIRVTY